MEHEAWVLGASGRTGRLVAERLHEAGVPLVLAGRDRRRLDGVAAGLGGAPRLVVGPLESTLAQMTRDAPGVVVSTVGPFATTAAQVARACPPGTHYVDVANELAAVQAVLDLDSRAVARKQSLVTAAGFGVLATESVVLRLHQGRGPAARVRVDAVAAIALEAGVVGPALAGTIAEVLATGGREVRGGHLVRARTAVHRLQLTTPDNDVVTTGSGASGELLAAWRASGADAVVAASTAAPANRAVRAVLPVMSALLRVPGARGLATRAIARVPLKAQGMARSSSWAHARAEWADGTVREGWLRVGDGTGFTAAVAAEVAGRLLRGEGRPGAHTPGGLFGPELAEVAGGRFVLDQPSPQS